MTIAWLIVPYKVKPILGGTKAARYCSLIDFQSVIEADNGAWSETEVLGNVSLCKVRASDATLALISALPNVLTLPITGILDDLLTINTSQRTALLSKLQEMGYTVNEINTRMGSSLSAWRTKTNRELASTIALRRLKPQTINLDGTVVFTAISVTPKPIALVDQEVI